MFLESTTAPPPRKRRVAEGGPLPPRQCGSGRPASLRARQRLDRLHCYGLESDAGQRVPDPKFRIHNDDQLIRDFLLLVFWWISFPLAPEYSIRTENSRRYLQVKVHHQYKRHRYQWHRRQIFHQFRKCCWYWWQICHRCQRYRQQICHRCQQRQWQIATSINDTGGKIATSVNDTGGKQWE